MSNVRSSQTEKFFGTTSPKELLAQYGSPLYVYNEAILRERCRDLLSLSTLPNFRVSYSAKANTNPALLQIVRNEGCVVDAMSLGELYVNALAGFTPDQMLYVCNNISAEEMRLVVAKNVLLSVDSLSQLELYGKINPGGKVMIRINPSIGAGHHKKVITAGKETKFGVNLEDFDQALAILAKYDLILAGLNQHIGSLFMDSENYLNAVAFLLHFAQERLEKRFADLEMLDFGGGFGIPYHKYDNQPRLNLDDLREKLHSQLQNFITDTGYQGAFSIEPGRYIVAECGVLLGTVNAIKTNNSIRYVGTDIGFNVLMRPVLYDSFHDIEIYRENGVPDDHLLPQTIVGNICESGDILAKNRLLPKIQEGDILGVLDAGAYGFVMASSYNQRLRPAEVLITLDGTPKVIRRRETFEDLTRCCIL